MMFVLADLAIHQSGLVATKVAADVQGRVFALRRMLAQASLPVAPTWWLVRWRRHLLNRCCATAGDGCNRWPVAGCGTGSGYWPHVRASGVTGCLLATIGYLYPASDGWNRNCPT